MNHVLITIPYYESIEPEVLMAATQIAIQNKTIHTIVKGRPADHARNLCVQLLKKNAQFTHVWMLDSDCQPDLDSLDRLLECDVDIACGVYKLLMSEGIRWAVLDKQDDGKYYLQKQLKDETEPYYADAAGAGCMLIRREVFDKIAWPWFRFEEHQDMTQKTEDVFFFEKCNAAGIRPLIVPTVRMTHIKKIKLK